jgi:hypothetical protein
LTHNGLGVIASRNQRVLCSLGARRVRQEIAHSVKVESFFDQLLPRLQSRAGMKATVGARVLVVHSLVKPQRNRRGNRDYHLG